MAGPIRGSVDWQNEAIKIFSRAKGVHVASPRRNEEAKKHFGKKKFREQIVWEHFYLNCASRNGVVLFYLARESFHSCARAYAQTTRFELGMTLMLSILTGAKVVVGIERGFSNEEYLWQTIRRLAPGTPVCRTLRGTCKRALLMIKEPPKKGIPNAWNPE